MVVLRNSRSPLFINSFRIILIVLGCLILGFGSGVFLAPCDIVAGGVTGIAIIINYYVEPLINFQIIDIVVAILNVSFFILGLIFLGKKFCLKTLLASFIYPVFLTIFTRVPFFVEIGHQFHDIWGQTGIVLAAVFGGMCVGIGCALTFLGGGSTGGVDILTFMLDKFIGLKQSIGLLIVDGSVILFSLFTVFNFDFVKVGIGILSSLLAALMIQLVYVESNSAFVVDIISSKADEIVKFVRDEMGRTTTTFNITGTYLNQEGKMVRFVLDKREFFFFKDAVAKIDPDAFITVCSASAVLGKGFKTLKSSAYSKDKKRSKDDTNF